VVYAEVIGLVQLWPWPRLGELLLKLKYCNLENHVIGWVGSFLNSRSQRVVLTDSHHEAPVLLGSLKVPY